MTTKMHVHIKRLVLGPEKITNLSYVEDQGSWVGQLVQWVLALIQI